MQIFFRSSLGLVVVFFFVAPTVLFAATLSAGVPTDPIWFSKDPFFEGNQITVFTPLYNSSAYRFSGTVELHDGTVMLGKQPFTLLPEGASKVFAFPWKVTRGEHTFSVVVVGGEFISNDKTFMDLPISVKTTVTVKRFVEGNPSTAQPTVSKTTSPDFATTVTEQVGARLPAPVVAEALPIIGRIEAFRNDQATRADTMKNEIVAELSSGDTSIKNPSGWSVFTGGVTSGDVIHSPWEYVKLFFALCYQFLTANVYAFYILCSYILYRIVRLVVSLFT